MKRVTTSLCLLLFSFSAFREPAFGQASTLGSVVGIVNDPSGAAIPAARVRVLNMRTGVARETDTDDNGRFSVISLIPGNYSVEVTAPNFQKQIQDNLKLDVAGALNLTFRLTVGQVTESISVAAEAEMLKSTDGTISTTIDNTKVVELPLNGRNFNNLVRLTPGATRGANAAGPTLNAQTWAVTGSRSDNANYTLDGAFNNGTFFKTAAIAPSIDAIAEFKVQTNMSAQFGAAAGANINVSIKSGGNEYHGALYHFIRNSAMDSRAYFAPVRPSFKFNQFGGTIGGPLSIPKLHDARNRTFFFFNYEGFQQRQEQTQVGTIPNAAWKSGDLSRDLDGVSPMPLIYDPFSATGPNGSGPRTPFANNRIPVNRFPEYIRTYLDMWYPGSLVPLPLNNANFVNTTNQRREDNQTHTRIDHKFSDKNNFFGRFSWSDLYQRNPGNLPTAFQETYNKYIGVTLNDTHIFDPRTVLDVRLSYLRANLGAGPTHRFIQAYQNAGLANVPNNFRQWDFPVNFNVVNITGPNNGNLINGPDFTYQGSVAMTRIAGRHTLRFGYDFQKQRIIHDSVFLNFAFNNEPTSDPQNIARTGHPFASLLLGTGNQGSRIAGEADLDTDQQFHHLWIQDDIKVTDRLTLNVGLRYEYNAWPHHRRGRIGGFDSIDGRFYWTGRNPITGQEPNIIRTISPPQRLNFAPRIGFAYRIAPRTVIRSAYGIFYNSNFGWEWSTGRGNWPFSLSQLEANLNRGDAPPVRVDQLFGTFDPAAIPPSAQHTISRDLRMPYMQNWNFGIEHQLTSTLMLDINYQGAKGTHLSSFLSNNDPPPGPGPVGPRRPFPEAGPVSELKTIGTSRYNGLTFKAEQRLSRGLTYVASYAYQKNIDLNSQFGGVSPQDNHNIRDSMGPSDFDQTHVFTTGYSYNLPTFGNMNAFGRAVLGGWQTTGMWAFETGRPVNITLPFDNANVGSRGNFQRPNVVGNPFPQGWTPAYGPAGLYFDTSAFAAPAPFTFGNLGRNRIRGPSFQVMDLGLFKNFTITERVRLQFRSEFFNAFNMVSFGQPGASFGTPSFGRVTGTAAPQRSIQFGLKLLY